MKGLFIFLVIICMIFFIAKLVLNVLYKLKKDNYYNNLIVKYFNDYTIIAFIVLLYAFSISLYLAGDYNIAESNFTLIILVLATAFFVGEKVYLSVKNRGKMQIESNIYELKSLAEKSEYSGILSIENKKDIVLCDKEKFEEMLAVEELADFNKMLKNRLYPVIGFNSLWIVLCIVILVVGLVRGA